MKLKTILLGLFFITSISFAQAQDVPETQMPILTKITASWCTNCGTWGWEIMEGMVEDNVEDAIILNAHASGDLINQASIDLKANSGANGQPKFYINNTDLLASGNNLEAKRAEAKSMIEQIRAQTPIANAGLLFTTEGPNYVIQTKTKFFSEMTGTVHLSLLVLENKVSNNQAPIGVQDHPSVIRASENPNTFGDVIAEGTIAAGTEIEGTYTVERNSSWNPENVKIAALLWTEENGQYTYVNGSQVSETIVSSLRGLEGDYQVEWRNESGAHQLFLNNASPLGDSNISLINTQGQIIQTIFAGEIPAGEMIIPISNTGLSAGNYFVKVDSELGTKTVSVQF